MAVSSAYAAEVPSLRFRVPGRCEPIGAWLAALLPDVARARRRDWIEAGRVAIDGEPCDRGSFLCPAGARIAIELEEQDCLPVRSAREGAMASSASVWIAIVDDVPWSSGGEDTAPLRWRFEVLERVGGLARVRVESDAIGGGAVLERLSNAGMPVVGDLFRGGLGLEAPSDDRGRRSSPPLLVAEGQDEPALPPLDALAVAAPAWRWDHEVEAAAPDEPGSGRLVVSVESGRALAAGHAWILPDEASDVAARFRPGALVAVEDRDGGDLGWARVEGTPRVAARRWSGPGERKRVPSVEARVARALERRRDLLALSSSETSAFRLIHGEGDALPGIHLDRLGSLLRVLVTGFAASGLRDRVVAAVQAQLPVTPEGEPWSVLEVLHLRTAARGVFDATRWATGGLGLLEEQGRLALDGRGLIVRERGLDFEVDPGWDAPRRPRPGYGLFVDQRENRERVALEAEEGGRWLNLFAHTGAFSVALLAAGAEEVTSVDLSSPYLDRLERNLALNETAGVDPARHRSVRGDVRRALERETPGWRGIVIDPPTAAAAGRRFWSVREDLEPLLRLAIEKLGDGGALLVTQNRSGPPIGLDRVIERLARRARRSVAAIESAPAGADHPRLRGFPEGDPFEGVLLRLS